MYRLNEIDDFKYITFQSLENYPDLFHCFTTRFGGTSEGPYSSMNLAFSTDDAREHVKENYKILSQKLSIDLGDIVKTFQTHTNNIKYVTEQDKINLFEEQTVYKDIDGLITDRKNIALTTFHADCTPIFFYDPINEIVAMAHAGWKGTVGNIAGNMVKKFVKDFASKPQNIKVAIGPSLGQCCFEVDEDVAEIFLSANSKFSEFMIKKGIKYHFDLWEINKYLMLQEGVEKGNIEISGLCTKCNNDLFFSHRAQKGKRGLMAGIIMMK
jgi:YfiH family protein